MIYHTMDSDWNSLRVAPICDSAALLHLSWSWDVDNNTKQVATVLYLYSLEIAPPTMNNR